MPIIRVYIDDAAATRLHKASAATTKSQDEICESLIAEGLLQWECADRAAETSPSDAPKWSKEKQAADD